MMTTIKKRASLILGLAIFLSCLMPSPVLASTMASLNIETALQEDGSAHITEHRRMDLTEGTEVYIPMDHEPGTEVVDFSVSEGGVPYQDRTPWNVDASRQEKAGSYGILYTDQTVELCWGIGDYGPKTYEVSYTLTNAVRQLEDGQSFFWKIFNEGTNTPPQNLTFRITAPWPLDESNSRIWAFGFPGDISFEGGAVVGRASEPLTSSQHVTPLVQFLDSPFQVQQSLDQTLADQEAQAKEGSSYGSPDDETSGFFDQISYFLPFLLFFFLPFFRRRVSSSASSYPSRLRIPQLAARNKDQYHRDLPYADGPLTDVAEILKAVKGGEMVDYFNAFLLKWIREGRIDHVVESRGLFNRQAHTLQFRSGDPMTNPLESQLWSYTLEAAGQDGVLDEREFTRWARRHHEKLSSWENRLSQYSLNALAHGGYLTQQKTKHFGVFSSTRTALSPQGEGLANRIAQFKNYLEDFSLLNEREASHVHLWEDLLIWAALYGIADQVAKEFEDLYPAFTQESTITYADFYVLNHFSHSMHSGYRSGSQAAASSGFGGGTSIGGGGGSFGGGSGGGTR